MVRSAQYQSIVDPSNPHRHIIRVQATGVDAEDAAKSALEKLKILTDDLEPPQDKKIEDALDLKLPGDDKKTTPKKEPTRAKEKEPDSDLDTPSDADTLDEPDEFVNQAQDDRYDANAPPRGSDYSSQPYTLGDIFRDDAKEARLAECERQFCQYMWACAGGRCQDQSERWKRSCRRDFELRMGECGCSNIPFPILSGLIIEPMIGYGFFGACNGPIDCQMTAKDYAGCPAGSANRSNCNCQNQYSY